MLCSILGTKRWLLCNVHQYGGALGMGQMRITLLRRLGYTANNASDCNAGMVELFRWFICKKKATVRWLFIFNTLMITLRVASCCAIPW